MNFYNLINNLGNGGTFRRISGGQRYDLRLLAMSLKRAERVKGRGQERLDGMFGMGRASYSIIPRVMMNAMSDDWKNKMSDLLTEFDQVFVNAPDELNHTRVNSVGEGGRMVKMPEAVTNYRHPNHDVVRSWMMPLIETPSQFIDAVITAYDRLHPDSGGLPHMEVVEYLDGVAVFGDPDYDWTHDGAEVIAVEMYDEGLIY